MKYNNFKEYMNNQLSQFSDVKQLRENIKAASTHIDYLIKCGYIDTNNTDYEYLIGSLGKMQTSAITNINNLEGIKEHYTAYSNICTTIRKERDGEDEK